MNSQNNHAPYTSTSRTIVLRAPSLKPTRFCKCLLFFSFFSIFLRGDPLNPLGLRPYLWRRFLNFTFCVYFLCVYFLCVYFLCVYFLWIYFFWLYFFWLYFFCVYFLCVYFLWIYFFWLYFFCVVYILSLKYFLYDHYIDSHEENEESVYYILYVSCHN